MLDIDTAIKHCLEVAEQNEFETRIYDELNRQGDEEYRNNHCQCAADHRQLAEWLTELKELEAKHWDECRQIAHYDDEIKGLEAADVQPIKTSKWSSPLIGRGKCKICCERCLGTVMRNRTGIFEETPFCPHCGAKMIKDGEQNG